MKRFVVVLFLVLAACSGGDDEPREVAGGSPTASPDATISGGYEISDIQIVERDDPGAGVVWTITFDARWTGEGAAERAKCLWQFRNDDNVVLTSGVMRIQVREIQDIPAGTAYPDEIPGQPTKATVTCEPETV